MLFVGDYIYEMSWGRDLVRQHSGGRCRRCSPNSATATRSTNPIRDLQAAHAAHPWIVTWDDHEVDRRLHRRHRPAGSRPGALPAAARRRLPGLLGAHAAAASRMRPRGPSLRLYDRYRFGDLAELHVLDDRQYRSHHACRATLDARQAAGPDCAERLDPARTMLGAEQEAWLPTACAAPRRAGTWSRSRP